MRRTQILLDEQTHEALRRRAFAERKPIAAVAREILGEGLGVRRRERKGGRFGFTFIGMIRTDEPDVAVHHDDYLAKGRRW